MAERYDGVWATVGLHPNHLTAQEFWDDDELPPERQATPKIKTRAERFDHALYLALAKHPKCVAIGECGLDYYRLPPSSDVAEVKKIQEEAVRQQFDLADEVGKPVVIHCRDAHTDQQRIIQEYLSAGKLKRRGVIHCFTGTLEEAEAYMKLGFLLSFTGVITFPSASSLQLVVKALPLDFMMVETDAPYLTPVPYRGKRNEPGYVRFVAEKIAQLKGVSFDEISAKTTQNADRLFQLSLPK